MIGDSTETRVTADTGGAKGQKLARFDLIPSRALWQVAELYGRGAAKYEDRNWERGYPYSLSYAALQRHAVTFWDGEDTDPETGAAHLAAVAFHALALLTFSETHREFDDRPARVREQADTAKGYGYVAQMPQRKYELVNGVLTHKKETQ